MEITYRFDNDPADMYGSATPDEELAEIDEVASSARYAEMVTAKLREEYPDATITVELGSPTTTVEDGPEHEEQIVDQIIHDVWESFEWVVNQDAG